MRRPNTKRSLAKEIYYAVLLGDTQAVMVGMQKAEPAAFFVLLQCRNQDRYSYTQIHLHRQIFWVVIEWSINSFQDEPAPVYCFKKWCTLEKCTFVFPLAPTYLIIFAVLKSRREALRQARAEFSVECLTKFVSVSTTKKLIFLMKTLFANNQDNV